MNSSVFGWRPLSPSRSPAALRSPKRLDLATIPTRRKIRFPAPSVNNAADPQAGNPGSAAQVPPHRRSRKI